MSNKIIVKPLAGLANRLRVIESALSLAHDLNLPLEVLWVPDKLLAAHFEEIFMLPAAFTVTRHDPYVYARSSFGFKGIKKMVSKGINSWYGLDVAFSDRDIPDKVWTNKIDIRSSCRDKTSYFFTCQQFYDFRFKYSWLKPAPAVQEKIDRFLPQLEGKNCIGIHIRRTDNVTAVHASPDDLFEQAIDGEIAKDTGVVFFMATDDPETEWKFKTRYGQRMLVYPKKFGRDSLEATEDAVVDLLMLSRCSKLYCSYYSSFSETAAVISGAETIICKNQ